MSSHHGQEPARIVVVGTSMGGLSALSALFSALPADFEWPMAVVQHRSVESSHALVDVLQRHSAVRIVEPQDKEEIRQGCIYLAPPDYHLMVDGSTFALSTEAPVNYARPSIDVLFETAAESFGAGVVAIMMTGASKDGARGVATVKKQGGLVIVQDPDTSECGVMPRAAIAAVAPDHVVPLADIGPLLVKLSCSEGG